MAVSWTYNGSTTVVATCTGLIPSTLYDFYCSDPDSSFVSGTTNGSGVVTLTISDIGGISAGTDFQATVQQDTHVSGGDPAGFPAAIIFTYGTSSTTDQGIVVAWTWDGTSAISATFATNNGTTYDFSGSDSFNQLFLDEFTGTGGSVTRTATVVSPIGSGDFLAEVSSPGTFWGVVPLTFGTPFTGSTGSVSPAVPLAGRVLVAFNDGPLEPSPTWTRLDGGAPFPAQFVAGYEITTGRQSLISQTDTGEATVDLNDHELALFDPRNLSSAYYGLLDGRQILLQLYDPVRAVWEPQFQGHIDNVLYDVDGSGVDQNGDPINVAIKLECVDIFDFLAGYGLTPGLDGVTPPVGAEDGVYYAETVGSVDDRIIEILADVGIDSTRYHVSSGSVRVREVKYDPDESALVALRDACDAELPWIGNMYCDRHGRIAGSRSAAAAPASTLTGSHPSQALPGISRGGLSVTETRSSPIQAGHRCGF